MPEKTQESSKHVTLVDVAEDADVSRATASLVARESDLVADSTRERVLASMDKLGYVYNRAAANLRSKTTRAIGLAITDIKNPFFAELAVDIESYLDQDGYEVLLTNTAEKLEKQSRLLEMMHGYQVDGVLLCPTRGTSPDAIEKLRRWKLPFVLITRYVAGIEADYVGAENARGAKMATQHLLDHGHRRIAFIGGPAESSARRDREKGYRTALRQAGVKAEEHLSAISPVTREGGYEAVQRLIEHAHPPSAALCYNDVVAFGTMLGLQAEGIQPGEDFAVVGFDNISDSASWRPALTTVSIPPWQIGERAVQLLLERIAHPEASHRHLTLSPELVVRESCGTGS
jgi:LacI family transcriptional regulator